MNSDSKLREPESQHGPMGDGNRRGTAESSSMLDRLELEDIVARQRESADPRSRLLQISVVAVLIVMFALLLVYG